MLKSWQRPSWLCVRLDQGLPFLELQSPINWAWHLLWSIGQSQLEWSGVCIQ